MCDESLDSVDGMGGKSHTKGSYFRKLPDFDTTWIMLRKWMQSENWILIMRNMTILPPPHRHKVCGTQTSNIWVLQTNAGLWINRQTDRQVDKQISCSCYHHVHILRHQQVHFHGWKCDTRVTSWRVWAYWFSRKHRCFWLRLSVMWSSVVDER